MNIRNKLLLAFLLVTGLSVGLLATIAITSSTQSIQQEVENALNSIIDEKLGFIYNYIDDKEKSVAMFANLPSVVKAMAQLDSAFEKGINSQDYLKKNDQFIPLMKQLNAGIGSYESFLISLSGDIIFSLSHGADFATNLKTGAYQSSQLAKVFDRAATLLETRISIYEPYSASDHRQGLLLGRGKDNRKGWETHAFVAAPIFKGDKLLGVLAFQLKNDDYYHLTSDYSGLKKTGDIILGQIINDQVYNIAPLRHKPGSAFQFKFPIGSASGIPIQNAVTGEKGSGLSIGFEGYEILAAWRHIPELQWGLVVRIDKDEAFAEATKLQQQLTIVGIGILLVTTIIAVLFSHRISEPMIDLVKASEKIAEGDFSQQITITNSDEIASLGRAFNNMSEKLNSMVTNLESANLALARSNAELDNFAYVASHDLKSPLRGIYQLSTWIWEDIDDKKETVKHLKMMRNRISRMENLLNDLLAFSRAGRMDKKIKQVNSKFVLESLYDLVAPPKTFTLEMKGEFPVFDTVLVPFELVFRNLINNAVKHHDGDDGRITISIEEQKEHFIFKVQDDGPGIAPKYHEKIFGLFQTLKSRDEVEGSGMGLAIIQKTLQLYGGTIEVKSDEGIGACFVVNWPKTIKLASEMVL